MLIAVVSDTHGQTKTVRKALALIAKRKVAHVLHCGDIDDDATVRLFPANTHFVYGNCDHLRADIASAVAAIGATLHQPFGHLEWADKKIAFLHGDDARLLRELQEIDTYDYLFHGHTHIAKDVTIGITRVINPGALQRANPKTFIVLDLVSGTVESVEVHGDN